MTYEGLKGPIRGGNYFQEIPPFEMDVKRSFTAGFVSEQKRQLSEAPRQGLCCGPGSVLFRKTLPLHEAVQIGGNSDQGQ